MQLGSAGSKAQLSGGSKPALLFVEGKNSLTHAWLMLEAVYFMTVVAGSTAQCVWHGSLHKGGPPSCGDHHH